MSTILVVEDDPTVRAVMVNSLEPMGHVIIAASTSEEALCHVRERGDKLDLLLVDVRLPLVSGLSVARQLRSFRGDLPVVLTSGHTPDLWNQTELANLGDIHGPNIRFLPKPFTVSTLRSVVSHALVGCGAIAMRAGRFV